MYTKRSNPPRQVHERPSQWRDAFGEARRDRGNWRMVLRPLSYSTAQQMASDIRSSRADHRRRWGIQNGEGWCASYGQVDGYSESWFVWIKLDEEKGSVA